MLLEAMKTFSRRMWGRWHSSEALRPTELNTVSRWELNLGAVVTKEQQQRKGHSTPGGRGVPAALLAVGALSVLQLLRGAILSSPAFPFSGIVCRLYVVTRSHGHTVTRHLTRWLRPREMRGQAVSSCRPRGAPSRWAALPLRTVSVFSAGLHPLR